MDKKSRASYSDDEDEEGLDPRIKGQLDRLNGFCTAVNHLEIELNDAHQMYRHVLSSASEQLKRKHKKLGKCVDKARPFYLANRDARQAYKQLQETASDFDRANGQYNAAKEKVADFEKIMMTDKDRAFDGALQELLNHATMEVMEAGKLKRESSNTHQQASVNFQAAQEKVKKLNKGLKGAILKSRGYFELTAALNRQLDQYKQRIMSVEKGLRLAKTEYADALRALEKISDDIHERRKKNELNKALSMMPREDGVGAESSEYNETEKEMEDRYENDIFLGDTVDGLDKDINCPSSVRSLFITTDEEEDMYSDTENDTDNKTMQCRGERPSVSGSEGNNDAEVFSDISLS